MGKEVKITYLEFPLSVIIQHCVKGSMLKLDSEEIFRTESFIDYEKNSVLIKFYIKEKMNEKEKTK